MTNSERLRNIATNSQFIDADELLSIADSVDRQETLYRLAYDGLMKVAFPYAARDGRVRVTRGARLARSVIMFIDELANIAPANSDKTIGGLGMNFGQAIEAIKQGEKCAREGWNGKGLIVSLVRGSQPINNARDKVQGVSMDLMDVADTDTAARLPHVEITYPDGTHCPWLASQTDVLAEDWQIVE